MRIRGKKLAVVFLACSVLLTETAPFHHVVQVHAKAKRRTSAKTAEQAQGVGAAYHSQDDIRAYIQKNGAALTDPLEFQTNPVTNAPYNPGILSDKTQQAALNMLKQIRYIAGISDQVEISDSLCNYAQAASFLNYVNKTLTHTPSKPEDMDESLYQLGASGAQRCNIAWSSLSGFSLNQTIAASWMCDEDISNIKAVGHRRWLLNPKMGKTGFGAVSGSNGTYSSVYAFDGSNSSASISGVAWPAQNMPVEYFGTVFPWSISMGQTVDKSKIKVTLTRLSDKKVWNFSNSSSDGDFYVNNESYGQTGCIIFRPALSGFEGYKAGDSYQVAITGYTKPISYTVNFFNLVTLKSISAEYKGSPIQEGGTINPSDITVTARYSDGSTKKITDFTIQPYKITAGSNAITVQYKEKTAVAAVTGTAAKITIQFDAAGGTSAASHTIEKGSVLTPLPKTARKGYIFEGWYTAKTGGTKLEETTPLDRDATYYAHWKAVELSSISAEFAGTRLIEGTDFIFNDNSYFRVTALYTDGSRRTVTDFTVDVRPITAGSNTLTIRYGEKTASVTVNAVSVEHISPIYVGNIKPEGTKELEEDDLRLYVKLSDGDTITVKYPGYTVDPFVIQAGENTLTVRFGGRASTFEVTGYKLDSEKVLTGITAAYTGGSIQAGGQIDKTKLTVLASYSDGSIQTVNDYIIADYVIKEGANTITITYQGKTAYFNAPGHAPKPQTVTVRFDAQGGSAVSSHTAAIGNAVGTLPQTAKEGYLFDGWYTQAEGGAKVTPETIVQADVTYYAHWTLKPEDKPSEPDADPDKPSEPDTKPSEPDADPDKPSQPDTRPSVPDIPSEPVTPPSPDRPDTSDTDKTEPSSASVTVTFHAQGGENTPSIRIEKNGRLSYIPLTRKSGWIFQGWYTGPNGTGSMLTLSTVFQQDTAYYAYWTAADRTMAGITVSVNRTAFENDNVRDLLAVSALYSDGTSERIYDYTVSQAFLSAGSNLITVASNGFSKSIQIQAGTGGINAAIRSISAVYNGGQLPAGTYSAFGGLTVKAVYSDGTEREVDGYTLSGSTIHKGSNTVTVHYAGKTAQFLVTGYQYSTIRIHASGLSDILVQQESNLYTALSNYFPYRSGYQFSGWYLDEGLTQKVGPDTSVTDGIHVYAKWQKLYNWKLNKRKASIKKGKTLKLSIKGLSDTRIVWKTSNKKIASVSKKGLIKAKKAGSAVITAITPDGSVMTCSIKVKKK